MSSVPTRPESGQAQHTPGPWKIAPSQVRLKVDEDGAVPFEVIGVCDPDSGEVAMVDVTSQRDTAEALANLNLIAAAPDLLAACKLHAAWGRFMRGESDAVQMKALLVAAGYPPAASLSACGEFMSQVIEAAIRTAEQEGR